MIGIIGAMDNEVKTLINKLSNVKEVKIMNLSFYQGNIGKNDVVILKCGIGKVQAAVGTTIMIEHFNPEFIINTGIAGGTNGLVQYDVVLAKEIKYSDVDVTGFGYELGQMPGQPLNFITSEKYVNKVKNVMDSLNLKYIDGSILSGDSFILSLDQLKVKPEGLTAVEMEGASIAQVCHSFDIPFVSIRFISDVVGGSNQAEAYDKFEAKASSESANICYKVCESI